ncbi:MAG: DUF1847 domain-containing protein [Chloroflexi bacterium]|nr:DUF1847 domain-containing protein [Chloroflexota bacterium]
MPASDELVIPQESFRDPGIHKVALAAAQVREESGGRLTRLGETMKLAERMKVKNIGLIFCVGLRHEARTLTEILEANGYQVFSAACKTGGVPKEDIGILDSEKVHPGTREPMCNPIVQAILLNRSGTELNILLGQCVGHDSLSIKHLEGWVTCLVTKDRALAHNPMGAIYGAKGYFHRALYQNHKQ